MNQEEIRKQADQLYRQGLRIVALSEDTDKLEFAAGLWEKALELYRQAGDKSKAVSASITMIPTALAGRAMGEKPIPIFSEASGGAFATQNLP